MSEVEAQTQKEVPQEQAVGPARSPFVSTSLYVGDLEPNVSEPELYEIFSQVGRVVSIRVCRDFITRQSLGYAHVNYDDDRNASRALELLNFTPVNGKSIRVMFSCRDPTGRKSGTANIFLKNLEKSIDSKALFDTFSAFGSILSSKVVTDGSGQSKGYGFVHFEQETSAKSAIEKVNGMLLNDKQVFVGPFIRRKEGDQSDGPSKFNNVYVKNIAETTTDEELRNRFGAFGTISSAVVMRDNDGKSKCFGFVNFEHADDAARAVEAMNGRKVDDKEWYVGRAQKKSEREAELRVKFEQEPKESANLYLKNLDDTIDEEKLRELFAEFGTITSCKITRNLQGRSTGSGFVALSSPEEANRAVADMNRKMVGGKPLYVAPAQRKEERRAWLQTRSPVRVGQVVPGTSARMYHTGSSGIGVASTSMPIHHPGALGIGVVPNSMPMYHPCALGIGVVPNSMPMYHPCALGIGVVPNSMPAYHPGAPGTRVVPASVPMYHLGAAGIGRRYVYGQPPPVLISPHPAGFSHEQQMLADIKTCIRPGGLQNPNFDTPFLQARQNLQDGRQRAGGRRGRRGPRQQPQQQMLSRGGIRGSRYIPIAMNTPDAGVPPEGVMGGMLDVPEMGLNAVPTADNGDTPQPVSISVHASALAFSPPEDQQRMLGEQLYPMVDILEHDHASKVTGMLLEMDVTEILYLLESPGALRAKVAEAMGMLRKAQAAVSASTDQLADLNSNERVA